MPETPTPQDSPIVGHFLNRGGLIDLSFPPPSQQPQELPLDGLNLFHLLENLAFRQYAGRLRLEGGSLTITIQLTGTTVHSFRVEGEELEMLAITALVKHGDVDDSTGRQVVETARRTGKRATYLLFERRQVTTGQIVRAVRTVQRDLLRRLMQPGSGVFSFDPNAKPEGKQDPIETDARALVVGIVADELVARNYPDIAPLLRPYAGRFVLVNKEKLRTIPSLRLSSKEQTTVDDLMDGTKVLTQVIEQSILSSHECSRLLYLLFMFGALETRLESTEKKHRETPVETLQRMLKEKREADHFGALGLHWTCHPDDIRHAAAVHRKKFGVGSKARAIPGCAPLADEILKVVQNATRALQDKDERRAYRTKTYGEGRVTDAARFLAQQAEEAAIADRKKARRLIECAIDLNEDPDYKDIREEILGRKESK